MDATSLPQRLRMGPLQLAPVPSAGLEWWFAQGHVHGPQSRFRIMMAFFLVRGMAPETTTGAVLLTHAFNEVTGESFAQSRVSGQTLDIERAISRDVARTRVPGWVPGALQLALWRHRRDTDAHKDRTPGFIEDAKFPRITDAPFAASWGGVLMGHDPNSNTLRLTMPIAEGRGLEAQAKLPDSVMDVGSERLSADYGSSFWYQTAPSQPLTGRIGTEEVNGRLWFDRQWGSLDGWLLDHHPKGRALLGWDWFALSLTDDWQVMLNRHHMRPDGTTRAAYALAFENGQPLSLPSGFSAETLDHWDSPDTGARYPIEWAVEVPDLSLSARLTPVTQNQELILPGGLSVWEGAGNIDGRIGGDPLSGKARMEMVGYGAVLSVSERIRRRMVAGV